MIVPNFHSNICIIFFYFRLGSCQIKGMKMHHRPGSAQAFQSNTVGVDQAMKVGVFPRRYHPRNLYRHQVNNQ